MIIPLHKGSVAEWPFENGIVKQLTCSSLERSLNSCALVASIFGTHRLLFPNVIRFSQWMQAGEHEVARSERVEKLDENISIHASNSIRDIFPLCCSFIENGSAYPLTIDIFGSGVIATDLGDEIVDNLIWFHATTLDTFCISVVTQSDVWLPFSLTGEPQYNVYRLNADRLANALKDTERQTGFKIEEGVESNYSIIKGFYLDNIRYADGSIADVSPVQRGRVR
jgi:hypothetical protein